MRAIPQLDSAIYSVVTEAAFESGNFRAAVRIASTGPGFFTKFTEPLVAGADFPQFAGDPSRSNSVILSFALATKLFDPPSEAIGKLVRLGGVGVVVRGIAPREFRGLYGEGAEAWIPPNLVTPLYVTALSQASRSSDELWRRVGIFYMLAISRSEAKRTATEINGRLRQMPDLETTLVATEGITFDPGRDRTVRSWTSLVLIVFLTLAAAGTLNTAGLMLARFPQQVEEVRLRRVLGGTMVRIVADLSAGPVVVLIVAIGVSFGVQWVSILVLRSRLPWLGLGSPGLASWDEFAMQCSWLVFAVLVSAVLPAISLLREAGVTTSQAHTQGVFGMRLQEVLVAAQLAFCVTACCFAVLVVFTSVNTSRRSLGFEDTGRFVFVVGVRRGVQNFEIHTDSRQLSPVASAAQSAIESVRNFADVKSTAISQVAPLQPSVQSMVARDTSNGRQFSFVSAGVSPEYFQVLGIRFAAGRGFTDRSLRGDPKEVVISRSVALRLWPDGDGLGKRLDLEDGASGLPLSVTVIGITNDVLFSGPERSATPIVYLPLRGNLWVFVPPLYLIVNGPRSPFAIEEAINGALLAGAPGLAVRATYSIHERLQSQMAPSYIRLVVALGGSIMILLVSCLGLYACLLYAVRRRNREFAIRMSCGAGPGDLFGLVFHQAARILLLGTAFSFGACFFLKRVIEGGIAGSLSWSWSAVGLSVMATVLAGFTIAALPAIEACRLEPSRLLRQS